MERRSFIKSGVAAGVTAAGFCSLEGCATSGLFAGGSSQFAEPDIERHLADLRESAAAIEGFSFGYGGSDDIDIIGQRAARVLSTTQRFRDLPLEAQLHPEMQAYMHHSASDVDDVIWRHTSQIRATGILDEPALDAALRSSSNPGLQFLESFDAQAVRTGMSARKRVRLRHIGIESLNRMRHAGAKTALLDAQSKVDRMWGTAAALGSVAEADRRATILRVGEEKYEERRREVGAIVDHWESAIGYAPELYAAAAAQDTASAAPGPAAPAPPATPEPASAAAKVTPSAGNPAPTDAQLKAAYEKGLADAKGQQALETMKNARYEAGTRTMKTGAWIMGASVIIAGIGCIFVMANPIVTLVMSATIGGVLLITGLIVLCVGAGMRYRAARSQV